MYIIKHLLQSYVAHKYLLSFNNSCFAHLLDFSQWDFIKKTLDYFCHNLVSMIWPLFFFVISLWLLTDL